MRTLLRDVIRHSVLLFIFLAVPSILSSQTPQTTATPLSEDNLSPAEFTTILKEAWTFLKDESDNYVKTVGKKTEFETTAEFEKRSVEARQQYLAKITKYIKDKKLDQRVIGVNMKAGLEQYDADSQIYSIASPTVIDAPYNLPTVSTEIPANSYVALSDTIRKGYRTSAIHLKFSPYFKWQVARDIAKAAHTDEASIVFKVRFKIDMSQAGASKGARFVIIPKQIMLLNQRSNTIYWEQALH
ncbi:MAG TPA: hypothetical protein VMH23_11955 [Bacteroidota bacterium]|nr:hypothetical protein [Bacteroidota bacterium]